VYVTLQKRFFGEINENLQLIQLAYNRGLICRRGCCGLILAREFPTLARKFLSNTWRPAGA